MRLGDEGLVLNALYEYLSDDTLEDAPEHPGASNLVERLGKDWNATKVGRALGRLGLTSSRGTDGRRLYNVTSSENAPRHEDALRQYLPDVLAPTTRQRKLGGEDA